ncbi:MAG: hypothetical protein K0R24_1963 [Gammaproteobacteria bacterium]|nr:hypothetical protein [Gammaproteobacteria bacterium]
MAISKFDILALFGSNLADKNSDFTIPLDKNNSNSGNLTPEEYQVYKEHIVEGILKAMQATPFARHYINVVLKSPDFKLGVSVENPWTHAYYARDKHRIVYLIKEPHFFDGGIDEAFIVFNLHEFGHAYFATIHSYKHYPPLLAKKDPLAFDYSTVPYYPITENTLHQFSKAIEFATVKIFWLLKWYKEDSDSFKKEHPALFAQIEDVLKRYVKLPVVYGKVNCEEYSKEIVALKSGERVVMPDIITAIINNEPGAMFIPARYSRTLENGKEYCAFLGSVGSASGTFPDDTILAIFYNLNILLARPHTEAYQKLYASYGPLVGHKVFGETIAVLFEGNALLALYPRLITLHFDNRLARAKQLGLPTELDPDIKDFISTTKSTFTLLNPIKTREIEERLQARSKSPQEIAKKIEDTQTQTAVTLFACVTAIPHIAGSILYGVLSATEQFAHLGYTEDEHSSGSTVPSIESILPIAVGASVAVAATAATTYCFWYREQKNSKDIEKEKGLRNDGQRRPSQQTR